jgi:hypothetical protein
LFGEDKVEGVVMEYSFLRPVCLILSAGAVVLGAAGMVLSFLYLASSSMADITAGTSGFLAGSVLIGSGLISLALLASRPARTGAADERFHARDIA